ncbi:MAG: hypothetical protein ACLP8A_04280 [Methylovirgula sp.]
MSKGDEPDAPGADGEVTVFPLLGYATHTLPGELVMVTLELPVDAEAPEGVRQLLRIGLRAEGARQLAASLKLAGDAAEMGQAPSPKSC